MSIVPRSVRCDGCGHEWEWDPNSTVDLNLKEAFAHMRNKGRGEDLTIEFRMPRCKEVLAGMKCMLEEGHASQHEIRWT